MARRKGAASQKFVDEGWRRGKQAGRHPDELEDDCRQAPWAERRVRLKGGRVVVRGAIDKRTRKWSKRGEANGVMVRRKYALTV